MASGIDVGSLVWDFEDFEDIFKDSTVIDGTSTGSPIPAQSESVS